MRSVDVLWRAALAATVLLVAGCGGSSSTSTTLICQGSDPCGTTTVVADSPTGPNTTEIVVDEGPPQAFGLGVANVPYVTVTVCAPGSSTQCATIDHVLLDTGSTGLRVLKSRVAALGLPGIDLAANPATNTAAGRAAECYPFVLGAVWGPLATADLAIAGETASGLTVQLIDDDTATATPAPAACGDPATGGVLGSVAALEANGILGVGSVDIDCGLPCLNAATSAAQAVYWTCSAGSCAPAGMPAALQLRNPVTRFKDNNNGVVIVMPKLGELGATVAKGRLVFGIGTTGNNQIPLSATIVSLDTDPHSATYLGVGTRVGTRDYPNSYIDTGSNAMYFDEATLATSCKVPAGDIGRWYCPPSTWRQSAVFSGATGTQATVDFSVANADVLFGAGGAAFANLAGSAGQPAETFAWGLPFFYGRTVFVSIWGQSLATNGPWYAF